jgi:hypothetical protein
VDFVAPALATASRLGRFLQPPVCGGGGGAVAPADDATMPLTLAAASDDFSASVRRRFRGAQTDFSRSRKDMAASLL